jgi:thiamine-monophosphate kinase
MGTPGPQRHRGVPINVPSSPPGARRPSSSTGSAPVAGTLAATGEFAAIDAVTAGLEQPDTTELGPGDDAAIVSAPDGRQLASVDMLVDGVHFRRDWASGEQIGRRAALAAMADIAAMGGRPTALRVAMSAPGTTPMEVVSGIATGLRDAAAEHGAGVVGGDLTSSEVLTLSVTALGDLAGARPVLRSGARPGDTVAVVGRLGWAAAGLAVLTRGFRSPAVAVNAYRVPEPPLAEGPLAAASGATSMIDVSDGLLADLGHIADASGVSIDVRGAALEVPVRLTEVASALGKNAQTWILTGGDDHALAATFPHGATLLPGWVAVGTVGQGSGVTVDGAEYQDEPGWDHFRAPER